MGQRRDGAEGRMGKDDRSPEGAIRLQALRLCTLIADHCPKNGRTESAIGSVRAGVRIALEELSYAQHAGAEASPRGHGA